MSDSPRIEIRNGVRYVGTDPHSQCHLGCGSWYDPLEFAACPICLAETEKLEREHWEAIARDALIDATKDHPKQ